MIKKSAIIGLSFVFLFILSIFTLVQGQNNLSYGTTLSGNLSAEAPQAFYNFSGTAGELVIIYVLAWEDAFQPTISLIDATGQTIASSNHDVLSPAANDARINFRLSADGIYTVVLSSEAGVTGNYTFALRLAENLVVSPLEGRVNVLIEPNGQAQKFALAANADIPTTLSIQSRRFNQDFIAQLIDPSGKVIAVIAGGLEGATLVLPAGTGLYELLVEATNLSEGAELEIAILNGGGTVNLPASTEEAVASLEPNVDSNSCIATGESANVRGGPGTIYDAVGALSNNAQMVVTGQNSGWYVGELNGRQAWVAQSVITLSGNCDNLPRIQAPPSPTPTPTATYTPSATPTASNTPAVTATPTATP